MRRRFLGFFLAAACLLPSCGAPQEQTVHLAVAANFLEPAKEIAELFRQGPATPR